MCRSPSPSLPFTLLCTFVTLISLPALAREPEAVITVSKEIPFSEHSGVIETVQRECHLQEKIPKFLQSYAKKDAKIILTSDPIEEVPGRVLIMTIVGGSGVGGGAWSGLKSLTVQGKLVEDGAVIGSFTAARYSGGGAWGGFKGTCSIFGRCAKAIGKDIALWLKNATMDAHLGDA